MSVEIKDLPELRVATVSHVGPYNQIGPAFMKLGELAGKAGLFGPDANMLGIYHDDPRTTPAQDLRSAAGVTLAPDAKVPTGLLEQRVPAGRYASMTHVGPYEQLPEAWNRFMSELPQSGKPGHGPSLEIYRNTPETAPQDKLITELYVPVDK